MSRKLQVVLPSFNEEIALQSLFPQFEEVNQSIDEDLGILVVDDGSSDRTSEVAESWTGSVPVTTLRFPENRGYGAALEEGVTTCAKRLAPTDLIATLDADDTHPPAYLVDMIEAMAAKDLGVVIASRYAPGAKEVGVSLNRRILSRGASRFYGFAFNLPGVRDYSCGYRLFRASLIQESIAQRGSLGLETGFQATGELLFRLREQTTAIGEVPFELHYERKPTASKMKKIRTVIATLRFLYRVSRIH